MIKTVTPIDNTIFVEVAFHMIQNNSNQIFHQILK